MVYLDAPPARETVLLSIRSTRLGERIEPERAVGGALGSLEIANRSRAVHVVSCPELGLVRRLAPGEKLPAGCVSAMLFGAGAATAGPRAAELAELRGVIQRLEARLGELEEAEALRVRDEVRATLAPVAAREQRSDRVRVGGSASLAHQDGGVGSPFDESGASLWDARLFVDVDLSRDLSAGGQTLARDLGFTLEWDFVRVGMLMNRPGEVYADLRGMLDRDWLNLRVGRFQLPFGENYRLYSRGYATRPFVTNPLAAGWWWDEGVRIHGDFGEDRFGYVFAWSNGDGLFQPETNSDKATTLKLWARPLAGLELSVSGHHSGRLGSPAEEGESALWFGESWIRPCEDGTAVPVWSHGAIVPDGGGEFDGVSAVETDAIWHWGDRARLWLGHGGIAVEQHGDSSYDRRLRYWIAELVVHGGWIARSLAPLYAALRANGYGNYDRDEGYLLDFRWAPTAGYNMRSLESWSLGLGWHIGDRVVLRTEYSLVDVDLVRGVHGSMRRAVSDADTLALELGVRF